MRAAVVEGRILDCNVLHRVLHPQVHENGFKKKTGDVKKQENVYLFSMLCMQQVLDTVWIPLDFRQ